VDASALNQNWRSAYPFPHFAGGDTVTEIK